MVQRGEDLGFALEPGQPIGIERESVGQNLERDVAVQTGVARAVDLAHAACADCGENLVTAESGA